MVLGKRAPREAENRRRGDRGVRGALQRGRVAPPGRRYGGCIRGESYRFRSEPQTTPLATRASISPLAYPNSASTSAACWLNFGGTWRRLGLLRSIPAGDANPLYQSLAVQPPAWTAGGGVR